MTLSTLGSACTLVQIPFLCLGAGVVSWNKVGKSTLPKGDTRKRIDTVAWLLLAGLTGYWFMQTALPNLYKVLIELQDLFCFIPHYLDKLISGGKGVEQIREMIQEPIKRVMRVHLDLNGFSNTLEVTTLAIQTLVVKLLLPERVMRRNLSLFLEKGWEKLFKTQASFGQSCAELAPHYLGEIGVLFAYLYSGADFISDL